MSVTIDPKSIPRSYRDYLKKMVEIMENGAVHPHQR